MLLRTLVLALLLPTAALAAADTPALDYRYRDVFIPLVIDTREGPLLSDACLKVTERIYTATDTFEAAATIRNAPEQTFVTLFDTLKSKNRDAMKALSHPTLGRDPAQFETQMAAHFVQFPHMNDRQVKRAYRFDDMQVFLVHFTDEKGEGHFTDFSFALNPAGGFGFLPYRIERTARDMLRAWLLSPWGPVESSTPTYCDATGANLVVGLHRDIHPSTSALYLRGAPLPAADPRSRYALSAQRLAQIRTAINSGNSAEFTGLMTRDTAATQRSLLARNSPALQQTGSGDAGPPPVYAIDAGNLQIVYVAGASEPTPWLMTRHTPDGPFMLDGYAKTFGAVFGHGPVVDAITASLPQP